MEKLDNIINQVGSLKKKAVKINDNLSHRNEIINKMMNKEEEEESEEILFDQLRKKHEQLECFMQSLEKSLGKNTNDN